MSCLLLLRKNFLRPHLSTPLIIVVVVFVSLFGCRSSELSESEQKVITDIFRSGLEMHDDPYVRAETLRAMELTGDPSLADHAEALTRDSHALVRIAALRKMVRADHPLARQRAQHIFNQADEDERYQVLDICLTDGNQTLRRTMLERALRVSSSRLRLRALKDGLLAEIKRAREEGDEQTLRRDLLPELGKYVDDSDPQVAATALRALLEFGQRDRAENIIARFRDESNTTEQRVDAGRILAMARVSDAREAFEELLDRVGAFDPDAPGIPERSIDSELLRIAVLGMAALGDPDFVGPAQQHLDDAEIIELLEVLDALAPNPSRDAAITLRTHMRDARTPVRRQAINLYGEREDAQPGALIGAMRHDDYEAQKMIVAILTERFSEQWQEHLNERLNDSDPERVERILRIMQTVLRTEKELAVIYPLHDQLGALATVEDLPFDIDDEDDESAATLQRITNLAAYVLFRISDEETFSDVIQHNPDRQTRYAYLESLATHEPSKHTETLRNYLYDDLYVLRLMAAAGLWSAFRDSAQWRGPDTEEDTEDADDD